MYNAHFKFRESPFGVTPDPQFYYSNAVNREAWAALRYGIAERKGFIVIAGEPGTGKTTLLRKALHSLRPNLETAYISRTLVSYTELLELILTDLGLSDSAGDTSAMVERLNRYLIEQFKKGNVVAVLIDEAQDLSLQCLEELRLLGNLETEKNKLVQIVLVGQPELEQKLDLPELLQLKQRVALRCRLEPVRIEEVGPYIESRLQTIGRTSADVFDTEAIDKIASYSKGIPRLINTICDNALLIAYAISKFKVSAAMIDEAADDLRIEKSPVQQGICTRTHISSVARDSLESAIKAGERRTKDNPFFVDSGDRPGGMPKEPLPINRDTHHWFRPFISTLAAIVLLTGLGAFFYSLERGLSFSGSYGDIAAAIDNGPKNLNRALKATTSAIIPQTALSAARTQALAVSNHGVSTEQAIGALAADIAIAQQVPIAVSAPAMQKPERSPRGNNEEKPATSASVFVVEASFVRAKPSNSAPIIATLEPGTRITVAGRTGEYYRIRSLGPDEPIRGYVHKEDAFFERKS